MGQLQKELGASRVSERFFKFLRHDDFALPSPLTLLPTVTLDIFEKSCMEGNACYGTMISGSLTLELDTDSDTAMNKLGESVSLTRMGEEVFFVVRTFPCSRYGAKPCARLVCISCDWRRGNIVCCVV